MVIFCTHDTENTTCYEFCTDLIDHTASDKEVPHFHKNFEILLVVQGECWCEVGGESVRLYQGEAAFIVPFQIHAFHVSQGSQVRRVTLHEHLIWSLSSAMDEKKPATAGFRLSPPVQGFFLHQLEDLFGTAPVRIRRIPAEQRMMVKGCLYIVGSEFLNQAELVPLHRADAMMIDVVQYIAEHFKSDISLRDLAGEKGYNYHFLSRTFNKIFGMGFKAMLNQYRMEYAYSLLQDTHLSVAEIAFESGFQSIRSLDHVCRLIYGRTPSELRKEHYV